MTPKSPIARLSQWGRLGRDERRTLLLAAAMVPALHLVVRIVGFNRLQRRVARTSARVPDRDQCAADTLRLCVVSVDRVKHYSVFPGNCLSQSLTLSWLLRRRGLEPTLRLGVRLLEQKLDAHAWVVYDGRVLNDTQDVAERFTPLLPGAETP